MTGWALILLKLKKKNARRVFGPSRSPARARPFRMAQAAAVEMAGESDAEMELDIDLLLSEVHWPSPPPARAPRSRRYLWSSAWHARFVDAVEVLGVDEAKPAQIQRLLLTGGSSGAPNRLHIKSHLQKYRQWRRAGRMPRYH